jgi:hypothetical protein
VSIKFVKILNGWVINYILTQSADLETVYMSPLALDLSRSLIDADRLRFQPVDATHWLNRSAGVSKFNVFRGRSFSLRATALSCA